MMQSTHQAVVEGINNSHHSRKHDFHISCDNSQHTNSRQKPNKHARRRRRTNLQAIVRSVHTHHRVEANTERSHVPLSNAKIDVSVAACDTSAGFRLV